MTLLVFSGAVFGVLFLVAYFVRAVLGPFVIDSAGRLIGLVHLVDLIFYLFAVMTVAGAAGDDVRLSADRGRGAGRRTEPADQLNP